MSTETVGTIILLASFFIMIFAGNHIIFFNRYFYIINFVILKSSTYDSCPAVS